MSQDGKCDIPERFTYRDNPARIYARNVCDLGNCFISYSTVLLSISRYGVNSREDDPRDQVYLSLFRSCGRGLRASTRVLLSFWSLPVRYNGAIRNKTEKTKETADFESVFLARTSHVLVLPQRVRQRAATTDDIRGQVYGREDVMDSRRFLVRMKIIR